MMNQILFRLLQDTTGSDRPPSARLLVLALLRARTLSVVLFRLAQLCGQRSPIAGDLIKQLNQFLTGADLAWRARIGPGLILYHPQGVVIGAGVAIGRDCSVQQGVTLGTRRVSDPVSQSPELGDSCQLGSGCKLVGAIQIGSGVTVGANAVCTHDAPNDTVLVGIPARPLRPK